MIFYRSSLNNCFQSSKFAIIVLMSTQYLALFTKETTNTTEWLVSEFGKIRTGRATPSFLDGVQINSYGSLVPLNQVASVTVEDAKTIRVSPWDSSQIKTIESAIDKADMGVSTSSDEKGVRVHFPDLTTETREKIAKLAKQKHEEARVTLRGERDEIRSTVQNDQKTGDLSEDESKRILTQIEDKTAETNKKFDELFDKKYQELTSM